MRRSGRTRTWPCWLLGTLGLLLLLQSMAACEGGRPAPTATRTPFVPQTAPTPASIQAYVEQAYLRQTKRLEVWDPQTKQVLAIDDPEVIRQFIDLLLSPDKRVDPAKPGPREPFLVGMVVPVKSEDHMVSADYDPQTTSSGCTM